MRHAEEVTFGGSGLDRAAHERAGADRLWSAPGARVLPLWRGKPLVRQQGDGCALCLLPSDEAVLAARGLVVFLGRDAHGPVFAADLSGWQPDTLPDTLDAFRDPSVQHHPALPDTDGFHELRAVMTRLDARACELAATARALLEWHRIHRFCARCGVASEPAQAGWQRSCPECGAHHFPRTDPVAIMLITHGNDLLLGRSPGWPERMYSLLAGFVEPGETLEAAVRRETFEEAGVRVGRVRYLASQPWPFPASLMLGCHGDATSRDITIDPAEIEHAIWVSREEMVRAFAGDHPDISPAREGAIAHFLIRNWLADTLD
ncbi:NAD(+) diphosphatase [Maribius pontilimi]|uniref:NAD(+) diphosphatase n=1 Tax=Palleronia pontilimi TaxID=1964209 RepID=A0A934IFT6_9RHOB|nr:NAD(+) diphosphatase [Palleronia pontilimi]MBJ3762655.1 NAD(+) diphosphatase [Palleronia pontilimi]